MKNRIIDVKNVKITISKEELDDYICITDIAKAKSDSVRAADVVRNWLRNRGTLEDVYKRQVCIVQKNCLSL